MARVISAEAAAIVRREELRVADDMTERTTTALRACTRTLSGQPLITMGEQLARLADSRYDLNAPPDTYGNRIVADLEARVADLLGKPAAAFFPSGTMAQQVALRIWSERVGNPTVAVHPLHHIETHERKAYSTLTGLRGVWPTTAERHPTGDEIRALGEPIATVVVELPLREAGFVLPTWAELTDLVNAARERGALVHFDGARLWESTAFLDHDLAAVAALADSVYVSFYKSLRGLAGAVLAGPDDFVAAARAWRHRYGGQIFSQWPTALAAIVGLETELPRLPEYVAHAKVVATALASLPGVTVHPNPPHTHEFQIWLPVSADAAGEATLAMAERDKVRFLAGWIARPPGDRAATEVTVARDALDWSADEVVETGTKFLAYAYAAGSG
jgi:threonine aldolase